MTGDDAALTRTRRKPLGCTAAPTSAVGVSALGTGSVATATGSGGGGVATAGTAGVAAGFGAGVGADDGALTLTRRRGARASTSG